MQQASNVNPSLPLMKMNHKDLMAAIVSRIDTGSLIKGREGPVIGSVYQLSISKNEIALVIADAKGQPRPILPPGVIIQEPVVRSTLQFLDAVRYQPKVEGPLVNGRPTTLPVLNDKGQPAIFKGLEALELMHQRYYSGPPVKDKSVTISSTALAADGLPVAGPIRSVSPTRRIYFDRNQVKEIVATVKNRNDLLVVVQNQELAMAASAKRSEAAREVSRQRTRNVTAIHKAVQNVGHSRA